MVTEEYKKYVRDTIEGDTLLLLRHYAAYAAWKSSRKGKPPEHPRYSQIPYSIRTTMQNAERAGLIHRGKLTQKGEATLAILDEKPPARDRISRRLRQRRDAGPPSSRRTYTDSSYTFAVKAALIRHFRKTPSKAEALTERWRRLVHTRMSQGKSPQSTAEHVARFESQHVVSPYGRDKSRSQTRRDPKGKTKDELRKMDTHELIGYIIDLERIRDSGAKEAVWANQLAAASSVYKMRLRLEKTLRRDKRRTRRDPPTGSRPIILRQVGSKWEVWVNVPLLKRTGSSATQRKIKDLPSEMTPLSRGEDGKLALTAGATPAKFDTKRAVDDLASTLGMYKLQLGNFVYTYVEVQRTPKRDGDRMRSRRTRHGRS